MGNNDFEHLFRQYYAPLCRFAAHILGDGQQAEEVVDDVFFRLWQMGDSRGDITYIRSYLYQSVRHSCLNEMKSAAVHAHGNTVDVSSQEGIDFLDAVFDDGDHPLGELLLKELDEQLKDAIDSLPEPCRRVYLMSRNEGMTYEQIAKAMGISVNTVKYHIKHAIKDLSSQLSKYLLFFLLFNSNIFSNSTTHTFEKVVTEVETQEK